MKTFIFNLGLLFLSSAVFSATEYSTSIQEFNHLEDSSAVADDIDLSDVSTNYSAIPEFSTEQSLRQFFRDNIDYDNLPDHGNLTTDVYISFVVQNDGRVSNFAVVNGDKEKIDAELVRVMKLMPKWKPGASPDGSPAHIHYKTKVELNYPGDGEEIVFYTAPPTGHKMKVVNEYKDDKVVDFAEEEPTFPNSPLDMTTFIEENMDISTIDNASKTNGLVFVQFIVRKDGEITDIKIMRGINDEIDNEAIRIIKKMPKWSPAKQAGKIVSSRFTLPIKFQF